MSTHDAFERLIADSMAVRRRSRGPDRVLDEILATTGRMRPQPRWLALIKEPPMRLSSQVAVGSPTFRLATLVALTMALVLALGAAVAVGASLLPSPAPSVLPAYGPAGNGKLAYAKGGDIYIADKDGTNAKLIVSGSTMDASPTFSPDGTKMAFVRHVTDALKVTGTLMVAGLDGSEPITVTEFDPFNTGSDWFDWMPDGTHLVVDRQASDGSRSISIVAADGSGESTALDLQGLIPDYWVQARPTDGHELIFAAYAHEGGPGNVYAIGTDGSGLRQIGELAQANNVFMSPNLSPDGRFVAFWNEEPSTDYPATQNASVHLLDLDTGIDRVVDLDSLSKAEFKPTWSPDGKSLAFVSLERNRVEIAPVDGSSPAVPVGPVFAASDDYDFGFSPDGNQLMEGVFPAGSSDSEVTTTYDVATGKAMVTLRDSPNMPAWQRVAP